MTMHNRQALKERGLGAAFLKTTKLIGHRLISKIPFVGASVLGSGCVPRWKDSCPGKIGMWPGCASSSPRFIAAPGFLLFLSCKRSR